MYVHVFSLLAQPASCGVLLEAPRNGTVLCREVEEFVANVSNKAIGYNQSHSSRQKCPDCLVIIK